MQNTLARYNHPVFARQYDSGEQASHYGDIEFYTRLCKKSHGKVLELACGAGRVTIPLKNAGIDISGIDFAEEMIKLARAKAKKNKVQIDFRVADVMNFSSKQTFDVVIFPYYSMALLSAKTFPLFVENVKKLLKNQGLFAFDISVPNQNARKTPALVKTDWSEPMILKELGISLRRKIVKKSSADRTTLATTYFWEMTDKKGKKTTEKNTMNFLTYPLSWYLKQFTNAGFVLQSKKIITKPGAPTDHVFVVFKLKTV